MMQHNNADLESLRAKVAAGHIAADAAISIAENYRVLRQETALHRETSQTLRAQNASLFAEIESIRSRLSAVAPTVDAASQIEGIVELTSNLPSDTYHRMRPLWPTMFSAIDKLCEAVRNQREGIR